MADYNELRDAAVWFALDALDQMEPRCEEGGWDVYDVEDLIRAITISTEDGEIVRPALHERILVMVRHMEETVPLLGKAANRKFNELLRILNHGL